MACSHSPPPSPAHGSPSLLSPLTKARHGGTARAHPSLVFQCATIYPRQLAHSCPSLLPFSASFHLSPPTDERHPSTATLTCIATRHDGRSARELLRQGPGAEWRSWRRREVCTASLIAAARPRDAAVRRAPHDLRRCRVESRRALSHAATATDSSCRSRKWSQAPGNIEDLGK